MLSVATWHFKDENKTNAPDDIRVKLLYDDQMKKSAREKQRLEHSSMVPLLGMQNQELSQVLSFIPADKQVKANKTGYKNEKGPIDLWRSQV